MKRKIVFVHCLICFIIAVSFGFGCLKNSGGDNRQIQLRHDSWQVIGTGGGGAMFFQAVSPHDPNLAFVACDMGGSYITCDGGKSWRMFNLPAATRFYVFDPQDENVIYANSLGLFKSKDKGKTWKLVYPEPKDVDRVISKGDHGNYVFVTRDSTSRNVLALAVDPEISPKLYAAISVNKIAGFYTSDDGGEHWTFVQELNADVTNIFIDPSSPATDRFVYFAGKSGISQRVNGQWAHNPLPGGVGSLTTYSGGYDSKLKKLVIYAISGMSYFNAQGEKPGIFFTDNGGQTWENRQDGLLLLGINNGESPEWRTVATSAFHPKVVYVSYNNLQLNKDTTCMGVAKSEDYGKTWKLVWKDMLTPEKQIPSFNFSRDWLNESWGPGWGENPFSIGVSPSNPDVCYTGDFGRTIKTSNGGKTWEQVYADWVKENFWASRGLDVTTNYTISFDPFDSAHVYIPSTDIGLIESRDGGHSWKSAVLNNGVPQGWVNTCYWLVFDPGVKGRAWAVMSGVHDLPRPKMFRRNGVTNFGGGIVMTENGGETWTPVSSAIGGAAMTHILLDPESPEEARVLYACAFGKGVYKSVDCGKTWVQKNSGISGKEPFAWQISRRSSDGALFLIVSRRSDDGSIGDERDGAVYKSADGAESWQKISLPDGTNAPTSIAFGKSGELVLSAWGLLNKGPFSPDTGGGIFRSPDDGKTWKQVLKNDQHIGAVTYDIRTSRFYACGFNSSAWYSEDNAFTWNRIKGYNFKWGQRVEPDPRDPEKVFINTFGGGVWHGPAKGDNQAAEDIVPPIY